MGRQLAVAMEHEDEEAFLAFLRASGDIALYRSWSPTSESIASFVADAAASPFWIHNRAFPWEPEFERVSYKSKTDGTRRTYFRLITRHAPLIEYSRHPFIAPKPQVSGRLYWSKLFLSQSNEIAYDLVAFDAWFTRVAGWIRSRAERTTHGATEPWCLPAAQRRLQNAL